MIGQAARPEVRGPAESARRRHTTTATRVGRSDSSTACPAQVARECRRYHTIRRAAAATRLMARGTLNCSESRRTIRRMEVEPAHGLLSGVFRLKVLVIGKGGREHALCWKLKQSPRVTGGLLCSGQRGHGARRAERVDRAGRSPRPGPVRQAGGDRPDRGRARGAAGQGDRRPLPARGAADLRAAQGRGRARGVARSSPRS